MKKPTLKQLPKLLIGGGIALLVLFLALIYYNFALATTIAGVVSLAANTEIELPAKNQLVIEIQEVGAQRPDNGLIAEKTLKNVRLPVEFRISYDGNRIDTQKNYMIAAKILDEDQTVLLVNNQNYNVIINNHSKQVNIQLVTLNAEEEPTADENNNSEATAQISGTVSFETIATLPEDARLLIRLRNTSLETEDNLFAELSLPITTSPIEFELLYGTQNIFPNSNYALDAQIIDIGENALFIGEKSYNVLTGGHPSENIKIRLIPTQ